MMIPVALFLIADSYTVGLAIGATLQPAHSTNFKSDLYLLNDVFSNGSNAVPAFNRFKYSWWLQVGVYFYSLSLVLNKIHDHVLLRIPKGLVLHQYFVDRIYPFFPYFFDLTPKYSDFIINIKPFFA